VVVDVVVVVDVDLNGNGNGNVVDRALARTFDAALTRSPSSK
jgi:hypothetical protein